jgi:hypothetical protein
MMKNTEWGMIVYLAQSIYGKNSEVWKNINSSYYTGYVGNSVDDGKGTGSNYLSTNGPNASTTGTVYGVYDMSGGSDEYVAAYFDISENAGKNFVAANPRYTDKYIPGAMWTSGSSNYEANSSKKGDAIYETSISADLNNGSWYGDIAHIPYGSVPFFIRGANNNTSSPYCGIFAFTWKDGKAYDTISFRPVVIVENGL